LEYVHCKYTVYIWGCQLAIIRYMKAAVRKGLTKAKILEEARVLVDTGDARALTMRALAARLSVAPMALYNHFHDRDAILDAMADSVFQSLRAQTAEASTAARRRSPWQKRLKIVVMSTQQLATRHPEIFRIAMTRPNKPASAFMLAAEITGMLEEVGLSHGQALTVYHAFVILLQGYPFWREGLEQHERSGGTEQVCAPYGLLPAKWTAERQFEAVVDWLLGCVAEMAG